MNYETFELYTKHQDRLIHGFTHRNGGRQAAPFGDQHMGVLSSSHREAAWENVQALSESLEPAPMGIVITEQVHGADLVNFKRGTHDFSDHKALKVCQLNETDGVFTQETSVLLMTFYADCTPIYFYDPVKGVIGMTHSGWRGTAQHIGVKGIAFMQSEFGSSPADIQVVIGPSAGRCCYEVDEVVKAAFPEYPMFFEATSEGHYLMDLKGINRALLLAAGILEKHLAVATGCTLCQTETYFSHRKESGFTGRMAAFMMLKPSFDVSEMLL